MELTISAAEGEADSSLPLDPLLAASVALMDSNIFWIYAKSVLL